MKKLKLFVSSLVIAGTLLVFIRYWNTHPQLREQLQQTPAGVFVGLAVLYFLVLATLAVVYYYTLLLCKKTIGKKENVLLTMYSTIANFVGPLQSGPGVRIAYLKKKHQVSIKQYTAATLLYYAFFALISGVFLLSSYGVLLALVVPTAIAAIVVIFRKKLASYAQPKYILLLFIATLVQLALTATIYFIELRTIDGGISFGQAVIYTGAANFAMFVSITPGALGFRESFLLLSKELHNISADTVLSASILDRAVYVVFLGVLFACVLLLHAKDTLAIGATADES